MKNLVWIKGNNLIFICQISQSQQFYMRKLYHRVQEDLMMVQAEFDALKKRGLEIKNIKESTFFEVRKSSLYKENIDIKASQTSIGRLFKENI